MGLLKTKINFQTKTLTARYNSLAAIQGIQVLGTRTTQILVLGNFESQGYKMAHQVTKL
jgi:hypothetical protein